MRRVITQRAVSKRDIDMAREKRDGEFRSLNVRLPEEVLTKLSEYAKESRIPKNAITELALSEYLDARLKRSKGK